MREKTTVTVEQADEIVSIIKPLDVEALSLEDRFTILDAWVYFRNCTKSGDDMRLVAETWKSLDGRVAQCVESLGSEYLWKAKDRFNDMDELLTALRSLRQTVETT